MRDLTITDSYVAIKDKSGIDLILFFLDWIISETEPYCTQLHKDIRLLYFDKIHNILEKYFTENTIVTIKFSICNNKEFSFNTIGTILSSFRKYKEMSIVDMMGILSLFYMEEHTTLAYIEKDKVIDRKMVAALVCYKIDNIEHILHIPFDTLLRSDPLSFKKWFIKYVSKKSDIDNETTKNYTNYLRDRILFMFGLGLLQYIKINTSTHERYDRLYNNLKLELSPLYQI